MSKQYSDTEMKKLDFGIESIRQLIRQKLLFSPQKRANRNNFSRF